MRIAATLTYVSIHDIMVASGAGGNLPNSRCPYSDSGAPVSVTGDFEYEHWLSFPPNGLTPWSSPSVPPTTSTASPA